MLDLSNDPTTPIMYRDIGSMSMNPMGNTGYGMGMMGGYYGSTNYLGGVRMTPQSTSDQFYTIKAKEQENKNTFVKGLITVGSLIGVLALGSLLKGKGGKGGLLSKMGDNIKSGANWVGSLFKKKTP
ncbi:MAG: hypothetical protein R3Y28_08150 [Candidatus Gastranaerophilales bacterium]